jgi:uncharacterized protein
MLIPKRLRNQLSLLLGIALLVGVYLLFDVSTYLLAEGFWFQEVDYLGIFLTRLTAQMILGVIPLVISAGFLLWNLRIARQRAWTKPIDSPEPTDLLDPVGLSGRMGLAWLLPITLLMSFVIGMILLHHGQIAISHWHPDVGVYNGEMPQIPLKFRIPLIWQIAQTWGVELWQPILVIAIAVVVLIFPTVSLLAIALLMSLGFGVVLSEHWAEALLALHPTLFGEVDPVFSRDIGFYLFSLPSLELLEFWLIGLSWLTILSVGLTYLLSGNSLSQGYFPGLTPAQQRHLYGVGAVLMLAIGFSYWLDRYALLFTPSSARVTYGASYTDIVAILPMYTLLAGLGVLIALFMAWRSVSWRGKRRTEGRTQKAEGKRKGIAEPGQGRSTGFGLTIQELRSREAQNRELRARQVKAERRSAQESALSPVLRQPSLFALPNGAVAASPRSALEPWLRPFQFRPIPYAIALYILIAAVGGIVVPAIVQRVIVQPNELQLEQPFIRRTIALTREAFDLTKIQVETFDPQLDLTVEDLEANDRTVENIRLWDTNPLLETNRQLQRIRLYYEFPDADVDRYVIPNEAGELVQQQVLISARELDYTSVPTGAQTWINQHLIYTHGYGFTMSPVNVAAEGGLPDYFIQGLEPIIVDERVQDSIPVGRPRIYFGEMTNTHVMTGTRVRELDYPSGSDNVYNIYDGRGGISIGAYWRRLLYAKHLRDWRMLFTDDFLPQTRLLFRRNIVSRVHAIAPFLRFDSDPYIVSADTGDKSWARGYDPARGPTVDEGYLYWVIDAYTTSDRHPYSDPLSNNFNYIRNSVKIVVDAYHGSVNFYVADERDPIIKTWERIFPGMFQPLSDMPPILQRHIRYPPDFYRVQSDQLLTYHMTDPVVFYNREDQWRIPNEIYRNEQQIVEPYYLIMRLPIASEEEFILLRPFTPTQRNNLIAWLSARSDGEEYGRMLLYVFPKERLVFGPEQVEARINQDPLISEQISLWNRQGSRTAQGNLLVIPIENSLLYVEPLYLEAEQNRLPTLVRVIVAYGNRIVMAETLEDALTAIFEPEEATAPIIRSVDEQLLDPGIESGEEGG